MSNKNMEISSGKISGDQFLSEIAHLVELLINFEIESAKVAWGWGCRLDVDQLWIYTEISVSDLPSFISKGIDDGVFTPNECDFYVASLEDGFEFRFCHEADIHLVTSDPKLVEMVREDWKERSIPGYTKSAKGWVQG